jgi:hypothetical protein
VTDGGACTCDPDGGCDGPLGRVVGDTCTSDGDCDGVDVTTNTMGGPAICQKQQTQLFPGATQAMAGASYPGGYCTRQCYEDTQCGDGNLCGYFGGEWGEALNICYHGCSVDTDCRTGYLCLTVNPNGQPTGVCIPSNLPDGGVAFFDAGTPPTRGTVGKACTADLDCQTGSAYGRCIKSTNAVDGGASGYPDGYCTADCTMAVADSWCMGLSTAHASDGGAWCLPMLFTDTSNVPFVSWQCIAGCAPGGTDCRAGYDCAANGLFSTSTSTLNSCEPDCTAASDCASSGGCLTSLGCYGLMCDATTHACK